MLPSILTGLVTQAKSMEKETAEVSTSTRDKDDESVTTSLLSSSSSSTVLVRNNAVVPVNSPLVFVHPKLAAKLSAAAAAAPKKPRPAKTTAAAPTSDPSEAAAAAPKTSKRQRKVSDIVNPLEETTTSSLSSSSSITAATPVVVSKYAEATDELRRLESERRAAYVSWSGEAFDHKSLFDFARHIASGKDPLSSSWSSVFQDNMEELYHSCSMVQMTLFYPLTCHVFEAFRMCPLNKVRVVIVGQDPYPQLSPASGKPYGCGLSFSLSETETSIPASLRAVFEEMKNCALDATCREAYFGLPYFSSADDSAVCRTPNVRTGDLRHWCDQGVLLLNASLTVAPSTPDTHRAVWTGFVVSVIRRIVAHNPDVIFCFWGARAFSLSEFLSSAIVQFACAHPSPRSRKTGGGASEADSAALPSATLSADVPFIGSRHFARVNQTLLRKGQRPIMWHRPWEVAEEEDY